MKHIFNNIELDLYALKKFNNVIIYNKINDRFYDYNDIEINSELIPELYEMRFTDNEIKKGGYELIDLTKDQLVIGETHSSATEKELQTRTADETLTIETDQPEPVTVISKEPEIIETSIKKRRGRPKKTN